MKNKILFGFIIFLFLCLNANFGLDSLFAQEGRIQEKRPSPSLGLSVQPGGLLIQYVKLGRTYDFYKESGIALIIENKDGSPHTYKLQVSKPSQAGNKKWLKGYSEIPDPSWFWFEKDEITVEAQSKKEVKMYLRIPEEERYYNQRWTVLLGISGKPEETRMLALAVYPRYQIETESKPELKEKPDGAIGLEPNRLLFEGLALGKNEKSGIMIYNNDKIAHTYRIIPEVIKVDPRREQITASPGYSWIPDIRWVSPNKKKIKIGPGESKELIVTVKIPKKEEYCQKKWEALVFVDSDKGDSGFARIQIQTKGKEDEK